jgi:hypothetical protein
MPKTAANAKDTAAEPTPVFVDQSVALPTGKVELSPLGMKVKEKLTFEEWSALAPHIGSALRSMAFVVGDWLVYGEDEFSTQLELDIKVGGEEPDAPRPAKRITRARYDEAQASTGIDLATLKTYVHVSRRVPMLLRNNLLSWEHHKAVAKLKGPDLTRWLETAEEGDQHGQLSARRLRASITAGRVLSPDELSVSAAEQGVSNHIPSINRLAAWWQQAAGPSWLMTRSPEQIEALLRDFEPVTQILTHLRDRLARIPRQQQLLP